VAQAAGRGWSGRAVEADDRVEVDDAAPLVFGDLGEGDPDLGGERLVGEPGLPGQGPAQGDGETPPEFRGAGVEQNSPGVVVTVRAQRLAEAKVVTVVNLAARHPAAVWAGPAASARSAAQDPASFLATEMDRPNDGAVRVVKTHGWPATVSGTPLPPLSPARMSW
jgi:hypothetical protein